MVKVGPDQLDDPRGRDFGPVQGRQSLRNPAERAADGGNAIELEYCLEHCRDHQSHQRSRHAFEAGQSRREDHEQQREQGERGGDRIELRQCVEQLPQFLVEVLALHRRQPEEILPLADPDDDADAGGEADDHRVRDEDRKSTRLNSSHRH